jgi:hypothetical protein
VNHEAKQSKSMTFLPRCVPQGMSALVAAVMAVHRCGALRCAVLWDVADDAKKNLKDCVTGADGRVS